VTSSTSRRGPRAVAAPFGPLSTVRYTVDGVDFDMVRVPPGRFVDGEGPTRRELLVSRPFELGVAPVTQALWRAVMGLSPSSFRGRDRPVERVSWNDAQQLMGALAGRGLPGFRLPTEAEWAWAARCGAPTRWAGSDRAKVVVAGSTQTVSISSLSPSAAGALDLSGNVWEWAGDYYSWLPAAGIDWQGPESGSGCVVRGGGWTPAQRGTRISHRGDANPEDLDKTLGVRLFRTVD
jgi:formylglycine-generating enzyme required for sulfatase activity